MNSPFRVLLLVGVAAISIGFGLWLSTSHMEKLGKNQPPPMNDSGRPGGYPGLGGDFTLQGPAGPVSLKDFRGRVVALYFGFTTCPDVCPTTLASLAAALNQLKPKELAQVRGLFISVDPERDTPTKANDYAHHFHPQFSGLSGKLEDINKVADRYLVTFKKVDMPDSAMVYSIDHSSQLYIIGKNGVIQSLIHHEDTPEAIAKALRAALKAG